MKLPSGYVPGSGVHKASGFGGFGERLLRKQGWEKGEGLGKNKTGRAEAIQVKKKEDTSGVGASRGQIVSDKWWEGAFDTALHVVNHEDSSSDSDSDVSTADEVTVSVRNSDGTITSAAQHELQIAAELAAQPAWFGGGRFGGREGKLARIRQQEALAAAKLGLALPKPELASATGLPRASKKRKAPHNTSAETGSSPATEPVGVPNVKYKSSRKVKDKQAVMDQQVALSSQPDASVPDLSPDVRPAGKKPIIVEPAFTATVPAVPFVQTPASGWWGAKKFKSAGVLEGMEQPQSKLHSERQQFDEDDQTNLYMAAQTLKTSGKKGLGTKSHIGKVAGAKWEGSKTTFEDDTSGKAQHIPDITAQVADSKNAVNAEGVQHVADAAACQQQLTKIKWKKLATAELQKAQQHSMKLKLLKKLLLDQAVLKFESTKIHHNKQALKADMLKVLSSSSQFRISGKSIKLM